MASQKGLLLLLVFCGFSVYAVLGVRDNVCWAEFAKHEALAFLSSGKRSTPKECCDESACESRGVLCYTEQNREYLTTTVAAKDGAKCNLGQAIELDVTPLSWCPGHYRFACKDPCEALGVNRCENGGTCYVTDNGTACICAPGYAGPICHQDIKVLQTSPCHVHNTANVYPSQHYNSHSHMYITSYTCQCKDGYGGGYCDTEIDECSSNPCQHGGTCIDRFNGYECTCVEAFAGPNCDLDAVCFRTYTQHDSLPFLSSGERSTPRECCIPGECQKKGDECRTEEQRQYIVGQGDSCPLVNITSVGRPNGWCPDNVPTIDCVDICLALGRRRCENGGTCYSGNGTFTCSCPPGYGGPMCQLIVDMLRYSPCNQNNTANVYYNPYIHCQCKDGFTGWSCDIDIDECASAPCLEGGTCVDLVNGYECKCTNAFTGTICEIACNVTDIPHCTPGHQRCEDRADNIKCTRCEDPTFLYNGICLPCRNTVANCVHDHCTYDTDSTCLECQTRFSLTDSNTACLAIPAPHSLTCDENNENICYIFFNERLTWNQARDMCKSRHGHLLVPETQSEMTYVENYLQAMRVRFPNAVFWIGAYGAGDHMEWVDGLQTHVSRWTSREPKGTYCVNVDGDRNFEWQTDACINTKQFICEEAIPYESTIVG